jgi:hypothetical protein
MKRAQRQADLARASRKQEIASLKHRLAVLCELERELKDQATSLDLQMIRCGMGHQFIRTFLFGELPVCRG